MGKYCCFDSTIIKLHTKGGGVTGYVVTRFSSLICSPDYYLLNAKVFEYGYDFTDTVESAVLKF